jgi:hypothetical protein
MVGAAAEQFNEGNLGRACTMLELAERLVAEQKVQAVFVEQIRKNHDILSPERLKKYVERADTRATLRPIMGFFNALCPEGLLSDLNGEQRRERRHELLAMLEVHGTSSRAVARELLRSSVEEGAPEADPFFQMNLVYLLRVIPRPEDVSLDDEITLIMKSTGRDSPAPLVKQVIAYLANVRHEKCERALITYLRVFESMLLQPETSPYEQAEVETLLDRTCAALARFGSARAWRALVDHGLKTEVRLGSPTARLVEAGRQDLSSTPDLVERMIAALKAEMPRNVLGFTVKRNNDRITWLLQALAGTATEPVRAALQELIDQYPTEKFTEVATRVLATLGASSKPTPPAPAALSGDLEVFGLPSLLQTLESSGVTGALTILDKEGQTRAVILLEGGKFRGATYGNIKAARAVYQLFERPFPGTFAFVIRAEINSLGPSSPARDVVGLILEGVRRHDEFKRASTMVPDDAKLQPSEVPPSALPDEDPALVRGVWSRVGSGKTPLECESVANVDSYHVRRLIAHWVEEGALEASA